MNTVSFTRRYWAEQGTSARAGAFAHPAVVASLRSQDWQFSQDLDDAARALVGDFLDRNDRATTVRVNVTFDQDGQRASVDVSTVPSDGEQVTVRARRPFEVVNAFDDPDLR